MPQLQREVLGRRLALAVSCTNSKSLPVSPRLRVADVPAGRGRPGRWQERLESARGGLPLRNLYAGAQWTASLDLESHARALGFDVDLWVVSAGLGLVPATTVAPAYAASFSRGADAVADTPAGRRAWWRALTERGRSFDAVAATCDQMLVVLAPTYLDVVMPDLSGMRDQQAAVVSSRRDSLVYSSTGLRPALRASAMTLNARAATGLLDIAVAVGEPLVSDVVRAHWEQWSSRNVTRGSVVRRVATDDEVTAFIESSLADSHTSRSALLAVFRAGGRACEQSRFQRLYEDVMRSST